VTLLKDTCGQCRFFRTKACTLGKRKAKDPKCVDFVRAHTKKPKPIFKDSGHSNEGIFETVYQNEKPYFLLLNDKSFSLVETVTHNDHVWSPKESNRVPYEPYGYYTSDVPNREHLFWKVRREFQIFIDVEPIWLEVLSACVLLSYQQEKLLTTPYIYVYGDNESGKSTVLQLLKFLCYRPMYGVTVPAPDIYGYLEDVNSVGVVLEDEIQGIDRDTDKIKIYKAGYKQGAVVPRTLITQHDRIIKYYNTFCFKACASERIPSVKGFRERFIEISMVEGFPEQEWTDITPEDLKRLHDLRNMLLKWRMLSREWELPNPEVQMRGRLKELWKPLLQITHGLTIYDTLADFVEEQKNERLATKQNTLEGHIVKVVTELYNKADANPDYIPFQTIWFALSEDLDGKIDDKKPHVMDTSEFFRVTKSRLGYRLREVLSGKSKVVREKDIDDNWVSIRGYTFDREKLRRIAKKYGYELVTKLQSLQSSQGTQVSDSTLNTIQNYVEGDGDNVRKNVDASKQVCKLGNSVTNSKTTNERLPR